MKIYNEVTGKIEPFKTINEKQVLMYVCGPTVYSDIHIGNARPIIFFDLVYRFLTSEGYDVKYVSNITDVDDKIINRATEQNISEEELVKINEKAFLSVLEKLNIKPFYRQPKVTEYMDGIIKFIEKLIELDFAYSINGDVYFRVEKIDDYGKISKTILQNLNIGARIEANLIKESPYDFTLWKATTVGINWDSPWSKGRPGWHTECVVMIREILGEIIDIHGGGMDLKFPHHENENAQNVACGNHLANYWMHNGFINVNDEKMSKSIGNVVSANDFILKYGANAVRLLMYQTNYRQPINLTDEFIEQNNKIVSKFEKIYDTINMVHSNVNVPSEYKDKVIELLSDDFGVGNVISYLLMLAKEDLTIEKASAFLYAFDIMGLKFELKDFSIPEMVKVLIEKRNEAKKAKDYKLADQIRMEIHSHGYDVLDTRTGVECKKM
jgi:cysteinyl-tRNA synthetase